MMNDNMQDHMADLYAALAKARLEFGPVVKSKTAKAGTYEYDYADLAGVIEATAAPLARQGLTIFQAPVIEDGQVVIHTTLAHASGAALTFPPLPMPVDKKTAQGIGSAITYGRRYALTGILNLAAEDDDGKEAGDGTQKPQERAQSYQARNTTRAASAPRVAAPEPPSDVDMGMGGNPFESEQPAQRGTITPATLKRLHALGREVYKDEWDAKRAALVRTVTTGATDSASDLLEAEAKRLCAGMDAKKAQQQQPDAHQPAANGAAA